tara:strand:- start:369 stop:656 length:288 start_codon:yes stop_codon:yes gene_type:complete
MSTIILDKRLYINGDNLDFEAGYRPLAKIVKRKAKNSPACIEIDEYFRSILIKIYFKVFDNIDKTKDQNDIINSSNVLEHIYNHARSLNVHLKKL